MAIKWKRNRFIKTLIIIGTLCIISVTNIFFFGQIANIAEKKYKEELETRLDIEQVREVYESISVLFLDLCDKEYSMPHVGQLIDLSKLNNHFQREVREQFETVYREQLSDFYKNQNNIDYYATMNDNIQWRGKHDLSIFLKNFYTEEQLEAEYRNLWVMRFDDMGDLTVDVLVSNDVSFKSMETTLIALSEENAHLGELINCEYRNHVNKKIDGASVLKDSVVELKNLTIVYGIPNDSNISFASDNIFSQKEFFSFIEKEFIFLFLLSIVFIFSCAFWLVNPKKWQIFLLAKKRKPYLLEISIFGILLLKVCYKAYCLVVSQVYQRNLENLLEYMIKLPIHFGNHDFTKQLVIYVGILGICYLLFSYMYILFTAICPVFYIGIKEYIKQYSYLYQQKVSIRMYIEKIEETLETLDFKNKGRNMILKLVLFHTIIIVVLCGFGLSGVLVAFAYSILVFLIINNYYKKLAKNYGNLMEITSLIAQGNFDVKIAEKKDIFTPIKKELEKIQSGFKNAVEEEVKSQRMKTELITNVSHDLKTPLTAITTYVELLKRDDLTEEEREDYIETLSHKSMRMKVLIEDLFELSKASSSNITLELMKVDLVNLIKQVCIEHSEKYEQMGLKLCWNVPSEKVELMLDNQKTYRIFENLFVNIEKYAMPNSRVYIDVTETEANIVVVIKNMSAEELNIPGEELTERFVRGDVSRNTEGSGLGLAIAKNLIELQNGKLEIAVDGDLFKTKICWKKSDKVFFIEEKN